MYKTIFITKGERIRVQQGWLYVLKDEKEIKVPLVDILSIIIESQEATISIKSLTQITSSGILVVACDQKHMPHTAMLPMNTYYRPLNALQKQLNLQYGFVNNIWDQIIRQKIINQYLTLKFTSNDKDAIQRLQTYSNQVYDGDKGNREAIAAKQFFKGLHGTNFIRFNDNVTNAALNYGYAILRSLVAKQLTAHGFNLALGIHHCSGFNPFNLADDFIEPLRPIVDRWTYDNNEDLTDTLNPINKRHLVNIIYETVKINNKHMKLYNATETYIKSYVSAVDHKDPTKLKLPEVIKNNNKLSGEGDE